MAQERRRFLAREKVAILRRHFLEKAAVSDLCDQNHLNPTLFYRWQKEFFENGAAAREARAARRAEARRRNDPQELLTNGEDTFLIYPAGETDAGTAGEQPARDSRLGCGRKAGAGTAPAGCPRAPLGPFGLSPDVSENSDGPQASRLSESLIPEARLSNSR